MHLHNGVQQRAFAAQPHGGVQVFVQPQTVNARMAFEIGGITPYVPMWLSREADAEHLLMVACY